MSASAGRDMGSDSVKKLLLQLALPAVLGQVVNLLYNIVDRIYIGHIPEVGASALTGVGLFAPLLMLLTAFAMMMGSGGAPLAAISMGKNDREHAERIMGNCLTVLLIFAVVLPSLSINWLRLCCGCSAAAMQRCPMPWNTAGSTFWALYLSCWSWA